MNCVTAITRVVWGSYSPWVWFPHCRPWHQRTARNADHSFLVSPFMVESGCKRLCACGCGRNVTWPTELRHQQGKGPSILASAILEQNSKLIDGHRKRKSFRQSVRQQLVGGRAPIHNSLGAASSGFAGASGHSGGGVLDHFPDDGDYPMSDIDAGPSGVHDDTPMQYSPPPIHLHTTYQRLTIMLYRLYHQHAISNGLKNV